MGGRHTLPPAVVTKQHWDLLLKMQRAATLSAISADENFDVLIIGGGINGCSAFRQLTLSGLRCLLIERRDFSAGTSSASSRMAHGGLRYLEQGNVALVRESLTERNLLFQNASHAVSPSEVLLPFEDRFSGLFSTLLRLLGRNAGPAKRSGFLIRIGLTLYDLLSHHSAKLPRHRAINRQSLDKLMPGTKQSVMGACIYTDGLVKSPERLALELVLDGAVTSVRSGALNYCDFLVDDGRLFLRPEGGKPLPIATKVIVNAAGPFVDHVNAKLGLSTQHVMGSQGTHLILRNPGFAATLGKHVVYFQSDDGRLCLAYAIKDLVFAGTTDKLTDRPEGIPDLAVDMRYIINNLTELFPNDDIRVDQVVGSCFGVRAFAAMPSERAGNVPRDHKIVRDASSFGPVFSLVGGKWTTFRSFATELGEVISHTLGTSRSVDTRYIQIGGGKNWPQALEARRKALSGYGVTARHVDALLERYGSDARLDKWLQVDGGTKILCSSPTVLAAEVSMFCQEELACHLTDIIDRRLGNIFWGPLERETLIAIAQAASRHLGWSKIDEEHEIEAVQASLLHKGPKKERYS